MSVLQWVSLFGAILCLLVGHIVRTVRWRGILRHGRIELGNIRPLLSLVVGYVLNLLLPFRLGEIIRSSLLSQLARVDFVYVLASVVFERSIDLLVLGLITLAYLGFAGLDAFLAMFAAAAILFVLFSLSVQFAFSRRWIWYLVSPFNDGIRTAAFHFFWSLADIWTGTRMALRRRFWALTVFMWFFYLLSLYLASIASNTPLLKVFEQIYLLPFNMALIFSLDVSCLPALLLLVYLAAPLIFVIGYYFFARWPTIARMGQALHPMTDPTRYILGPSDQGIPRFRSVSHYGEFLERKFSGEKSLIHAFENNALAGVEVLRLFHGGSGAVTALVEVDDHIRVRKYADGPVAQKLDVQYKWIETNSNELPMVKIVGSQMLENSMFYDMEWVGSSRDMYEAVHTEPVEVSRQLLDEITEKITAFHTANAKESASYEVVASYIESKVCGNFQKIKARLLEIFDEPFVSVNGQSLRVEVFKAFETKDWMMSRLIDRRQSAIHGDLTVENILVRAASDGTLDWFLIDPNPENIFDSPYIDFAKLLQSLHLGYESLNRNAKASLVGKKIAVNMHVSLQYSELYQHFVEQFRTRFGDAALKEIFLHEMVNYLRLIPYQYDRDPMRGLAFFACFCILLQDYDKAFEGDLP